MTPLTPIEHSDLYLARYALELGALVIIVYLVRKPRA